MAGIRSVMEKIELHFFHGFLGAPADWNRVQEFVPQKEKYIIVNHSLSEDFCAMSKEPSFNSWAALKNKQISESPNKKIIVGYSLGGRLALHLDSDLYDAVLLFAAHPGMNTGKEKRIESDFIWVEKSKKLSVPEWLKQWNSQDVFKNDRVRPERVMTQGQLGLHMDMLLTWSLARQSMLDEKIKKNSEKVYWACGEEDKKFLNLKDRVSDILPKDHIMIIEEAGHGILFDQPEAAAKVIDKVIKYVV